MEKKARPDWQKLFDSVLEEPGIIGDYYSLFHNYSLGNQALAIDQMIERGIPIGPIASFNAWKRMRRKVKKGEKAIALWMPIIARKKEEPSEAEDGEEQEAKETRTVFFVMRNNWFALSQTEPLPGKEAEVTEPMSQAIEWDCARALQTLGIKEIPFQLLDGNTQGYAHPNMKAVAINPLAAYPLKTLFHEIAHCLLHSDEETVDFDGTPARDIMEAEAESVAFLCCAALGLPGLEESRGYVQHWLRDESRRAEFKKKSPARVFGAAEKILKAGRIKEEENEEEKKNIA